MASIFEATAGNLVGPATGGTVTQATSKSTAVTLNAESGQITLDDAALAAAAEVSSLSTTTRSLLLMWWCATTVPLEPLVLTLCRQTALLLDLSRSRLRMCLPVHLVRQSL